MKKLILLFAMLALFAACEEDKNTAAAGRGYIDDEEKMRDTMTPPVMPSDTLYYDIQGFNKTSPDCQSDTANCATFVASFPLIEMRLHHRIADSVNNMIRGQLYRPLIGDKPANGIKNLLEPYFAAYATELENAQNKGAQYIVVWSVKREFTVIENTKKIFTVKHFERSYTGGPHPNHFINYYHFNPQTGKQLRVADIFKAGTEEALNKLGEKKFRKQNKMAAGISLDDAGYFSLTGKFYLPHNFLLKEKGVLFIYNPYEVASYDQGQIDLFFTYQELENLLRDEFNPFAQQAS
jgi:hypothetical protein